MAYWGYADAVNAAAAPFLAREFGLDDAGIAWASGFMALGALGTYALARQADRLGRRRALLLSLAALAPLSLGSAAAPTLTLFVLAQIPTQGCKGLLAAVIPVMVAEHAPERLRAHGQGIVGIAGSIGSGLALVLVAACEHVPGTWRWAWAAAGLGIAAVPAIRSRLSESARFESAAARGETRDARARDLLRPAYRTRTLGGLVVVTLYQGGITGALGWILYHPIRNLGVEPLAATGVVIAGGAAGLVGFPLGSRLCEAWGRRATFAVSGALYTLAAIAFYAVPADASPSPAIWLAPAFALMSGAANAVTVPLRASGTELFPTRLRGTFLGWAAVATASALVATNFAVGALARWLGGIAPAASVTSLAMLVAVAVFLLWLPETTGLALEAAALEDPPPPPGGD